MFAAAMTVLLVSATTIYTESLDALKKYQQVKLRANWTSACLTHGTPKEKQSCIKAYKNVEVKE